MNDKNASHRIKPSLDDRQAAERKLCHFFKSLGIDAIDQRERLVDPYLDRAASFWRHNAGFDLGKLAVEEAETDLENWFEVLLGERLADGESALMLGRAAFLMCRGPKHFAGLLLQPVSDLPGEFVSALLDGAPTPVPPNELGDMDHQPYEAWSPISAVSRVVPGEGGLLQSLGWRNSSSAS